MASRLNKTIHQCSLGAISANNLRRSFHSNIKLLLAFKTDRISAFENNNKSTRIAY